MNLVDLFLARARDVPGRVALVAQGGSITFGELARRSAGLARHLQALGLEPGQRVLPMLGLGIPLYITLLALFRLGAVAVFPDPARGLPGWRDCSRRLAPRALVGEWPVRLLRYLFAELRAIPYATSPHAGPADAETPWVDLDAAAPALITFTSGSTGRPKGIIRSHGFLLEQHRQLQAVLQPTPGQVELNSLPVFILGNLASGVTSVLPAGDLRRPGALDPRPILLQIEAHRVNRLLVPPSLCERLAVSGRRLPGITRVFTGGGPVFPDLLRRLGEMAPNARITAVYGSSEAEPIAHVDLDQITAADFAAMAAGAGLLAGVPVPDLRLRFEDDEIWLTGPHVVKGYLDPADDAGIKPVLAGEIWHRSGDAGRLDEQGRLWLLGRHLARCAGLYPFQVEVAGRALPGVHNAALACVDGRPILALERSAATPLQLPDDWNCRWQAPLAVVEVAQIPMDRRHHSKVDYTRLEAMVRRAVHQAPAGAQARGCDGALPGPL